MPSPFWKLANAMLCTGINEPKSVKRQLKKKKKKKKKNTTSSNVSLFTRFVALRVFFLKSGTKRRKLGKVSQNSAKSAKTAQRAVQYANETITHAGRSVLIFAFSSKWKTQTRYTEQNRIK
ncbi:hypothetical protein POVWA2_011090 [Plasmodium ovale wallikeri]|uniref:Uncharacterized protein n=1 Tax=Plasmodium ovale wallikeri TaxID=864142 RepID=A0A1A8YME9_PLAOA|nr:hypothetical protein POVWA2_011090 [Plasmodium ovale wallikeri]